MNIRKYLSLFVLLFMFKNGTYAQEIDSMLNVYAEQYPLQKVHVHFDKDIYRAGESIWFKAYIFTGFSPAFNSKSFYTELLDENGVVIQQRTYPVVEASAAGNFDLPANIAGGTFRFRAYTMWMLNFDTSYIFKKDLIISGTKGEVKKVAPSSLSQSTTLTFFPEGGDLVTGIESLVAFKATNAHGMPVEVTGKIYDSKGAEVAQLKTLHNGMGTFNFTPAATETYTTRWKPAGGTEQTTTLPAAKAEGIVLIVKNSGEKKIFSIVRTDNAADKFKRLRIIAQVGQRLIYKAKVPLTSSRNGGAIPTKNIPDGILTITVFTEQWEPLAERIIMINNRSHVLSASLTTTATGLTKRAKNSFEINVPDTNLTNLSVSVTDAGLASNAMKDNIYSRLLLTGDIKGYVHNASYYFSNNSDSVANHLDLVMLTNGWRRYKWEDVVARRTPTLKFHKEPSLSINAKVFGVTPYSPLRNDEQITAIVETKDSSKLVFSLNKTGRETFSAGDVLFYDTAKVYYQFVKNKAGSSSYSVTFDNGLYRGPRRVRFDTLPTTFSWYDTTLIARNRNVANEVIKYVSTLSTDAHQLGPVVVKTKVRSRAEQLDEQYASGMFRGGDGYSYDFTSDVFARSAMNVFAYLQSRVAGLNISNATGGTPSVQWRGSATSLFLNEMPVEADQLSSLSVNDIAYVKVFRPPFFGAMGGGAGGAIAVYTRKGGDVAYAPGTGGLSKNILVGYAPLKEFYSPNYSTPEQSENVQSDYRTTLYWNPFIFFDGQKQKVKIDFYNNDYSKSYKIVVEGVNDIGKMIRIEKVVQ